MPLQTTGAISIGDCLSELNYGAGSTGSLGQSDMRTLAGVSSGAISLDDFYGASNIVEATLTSPNFINGYYYTATITVSQLSGFTSGMHLRIPSNMMLQAITDSHYALIVDIPCTIINDGFIFGRGGRGGQYGTPSFFSPSSARDGGDAIYVNSSGVTIINNSGAYIAGGGGGGAVGYDNSGTHGSAHYVNAGGGGGAGGSYGGRAGATGNKSGGGDGQINSAGGNGVGSVVDSVGGLGGGAGGGGDSILNFGSNDGGVGGGGGGRQVPGVGGGNGLSGTTANGGSGGNAGNGVGGSVSNVSGGGGGWGASGGNGQGGYYGGSGGAAITGPYSRSLTNNGTIYGST